MSKADGRLRYSLVARRSKWETGAPPVFRHTRAGVLPRLCSDLCNMYQHGEDGIWCLILGLMSDGHLVACPVATERCHHLYCLKHESLAVGAFRRWGAAGAHRDTVSGYYISQATPIQGA